MQVSKSNKRKQTKRNNNIYFDSNYKKDYRKTLYEIAFKEELTFDNYFYIMDDSEIQTENIAQN